MHIFKKLKPDKGSCITFLITKLYLVRCGDVYVANIIILQVLKHKNEISFLL